MSLIKYLSADKEHSIFFSGITVLASSAAVISVSNELYTVTAMSVGAAAVGLIGLMSKAIIELTTPAIDTAVQALTGSFKAFDNSAYSRTCKH